MGLDCVEVLMEVEDEFGIQIPDRDAQCLSTIGALATYVASCLGTESGRTAEGCPTSRAFYVLRRVFMTDLNVARRSVHPRLELASMIPIARRQQLWDQLRLAGLHAPALRTPNAIQASLILLAGAIGTLLMVTIGWGATLLWIPMACGLAIVALRQSQVFFPCATVGDLARQSWLEPVATNRSASQGRETVLNQICDIIAEQMGLPRESLHSESQFRDLFD